MLESLEQSNIKRMSVEAEKRPEVMFDPERDITAAQWNKIEEDYKVLQDQQRWLAAIIRANLTIMGEQDRLPDLTDEQFREMLVDLYNSHNDQIMYAANLKIINPDRTIDLDKLNWHKINEEMNNYYNSGNLRDFGAYLNRLVAVNILHGHRGGIHIDKVKQAIELSDASQMVDERANLLAKARLLFPDIKIDITDEDWQGWKKWMDRPSGMEDAWLGANLTILQAEDARLENGRIKITMPKKKTEQENLMPEQRDF